MCFTNIFKNKLTTCSLKKIEFSNQRDCPDLLLDMREMNKI